MFSPVPAISISPRSAQHIQDLLEAGPVTLEIEGRVDTLSEKFSESVNVAGILRGTTRADEYVVISGHIDTWWAGSNDDCSSIAVVLELARLFSEARTLGTFVNERTLVFMSVGAEETGGPGGTWYNWLVGSYEFVLAHPEFEKAEMAKIPLHRWAKVEDIVPAVIFLASDYSGMITGDTLLIDGGWAAH